MIFLLKPDVESTSLFWPNPYVIFGRLMFLFCFITAPICESVIDLFAGSRFRHLALASSAREGYEAPLSTLAIQPGFWWPQGDPVRLLVILYIGLTTINIHI